MVGFFSKKTKNKKKISSTSWKIKQQQRRMWKKNTPLFLAQTPPIIIIIHKNKIREANWNVEKRWKFLLQFHELAMNLEMSERIAKKNFQKMIFIWNRIEYRTYTQVTSVYQKSITPIHFVERKLSKIPENNFQWKNFPENLQTSITKTTNELSHHWKKI